MKKLLFGCLILVETLSLAVSCATFSTKSEVPQKTIPILSFVPKSGVPTGQEIASYLKVFGICIDYDAFVAAVAGKDYDVVETFYFVFSKVSAVAK